MVLLDDESGEVLRKGPAPEIIPEFLNEDLGHGKEWENVAWMIVDHFFQTKKLVHQQLDSFNAFITTDLFSCIVDSPPLVIERREDYSGKAMTGPVSVSPLLGKSHELFICFLYVF